MEKIKSYIKLALIVALVFLALNASRNEENKSKIAEAKKQGVQICQPSKPNPNRIVCVDSDDKNYIQDSLEKFGLDYNICTAFVKEKLFDEVAQVACENKRNKEIAEMHIAKIKKSN